MDRGHSVPPQRVRCLGSSTLTLWTVSCLGFTSTHHSFSCFCSSSSCSHSSVLTLNRRFDWESELLLRFCWLEGVDLAAAAATLHLALLELSNAQIDMCSHKCMSPSCNKHTQIRRAQICTYHQTCRYQFY